jgi:uncharacterized membrane protein
LIGLFLPAARSASGTREIAAPQDLVWQMITGLAAQPTWRSDLASVDVIDTTLGKERWVERPHKGPSIQFLTESMTQKTAWKVRFSGPAEGIWSCRLEPLSERRTRVYVEESSMVQNYWARVLARLVFDPQAFLDSYLDQLSKAAEQNVG